MTQTYLTQIELARRWKMSPRTLERWRSVGVGPAFLKIAGRALYDLAEIEAHEQREQWRAKRYEPVSRRLTADPARGARQANTIHRMSRAC